MNTLISFGNSLLYTTVFSEIYRTHLDPRIGYLHETNQRSFTLNLDIAEAFKPIIVNRVIFSLLKRGQTQLKHFEEEVEFSYLNEKGKAIFVKEYEDKLNATIKHRNFGKSPTGGGLHILRRGEVMFVILVYDIKENRSEQAFTQGLYTLTLSRLLSTLRDFRKIRGGRKINST